MKKITHIFLAVVLVWLTGCSKTPTREEFKAAVYGKTTQEVIEYAGKPAENRESRNRSTWVYNAKTLDSVTGKKDRYTMITFGENGRVKTVDFTGGYVD